MPALLQDQASPGLSEASSDAYFHSNVQIVEDSEYPAISFDGYSEKPLSQQLEPIAVVGMGCRLPEDVTSPSEFWEMMMNKGTGQAPKVPKSRFNIDAHFHSNNERPGSFNVPGGYFLNSSLQEFDPAFFGISPIEAIWMDPQQRKLLEVVYESLESGGISLNSISGSKTGCFVGSFTSDFQQMSMKEPDFRHSYTITGVDPGLLSNRINYVFNLTGPSSTVNTACSSSLYALHEACNALRNKECSAAIAGGTNLVLTVDQHMNTAKIGVLSPTSACHTFDESADGYGRADGIAALYLKRLGDAVRDGDPIRAVIRSSAVNSNGKAPAVGISHPSLGGQEAVIRHAYLRGGNLDPRLTGYFECHGTGTPVGDPLEVHALANAMNERRNSEQEPLWIGAVKPNIGHSEAASGISAVIKAVLALETGIIPPTRGVIKPNPKIAWDDWKVRVVNSPIPFPEKLPVKRVSVNSFGYGGTNAHVILEEADSLIPCRNHVNRQNKVKETPRSTFDRNRPYLLPFSAHEQATLKNNIDSYGLVAQNYELVDLSYTLTNRRTQLQSRGFTVASYENLDACFKNNYESFVFAEKKSIRAVGFVFTGQGAQWARMGAELMAYYSSFLRSIRVLDRSLHALADGPAWTLEEELLRPSETSRINEAEFSQPLCTAIQIAIVQLLEDWGIQPVVAVGHSSGEIGAAFSAGLISATEAIIVAFYRGKAVCDMNTDGAMMAVGLGADDVEPYLEEIDGKVTIACHNSPTSVTLSGDSDALGIIKSRLDTEKTFARFVETGGKAYHSHHTTAVATKYANLLHLARANNHFDPPKSSKAIMVSSVTASRISPQATIDERYWSANLCSPVLFQQAIQAVATDGQFANVDLLIEIGPHSALSGAIRQICTTFKFDKLTYLPTLRRNTNSASQLLTLAGELFLKDYPLDTEQISLIEEPLPNGKTRQVRGCVIVDLPTYQWNYTKDYWTETRRSREHRAPRYARHDILGARIPGGSLAEPLWRNILRIRDIPWLQHHSLGGEAVFPAAGYFSMAIEAITQLNEESPKPVQIDGYVLRNISIKTALVTPNDDTGIEIMCSLRPSIFGENDTEQAWWDFNISSISEAGYGNDHMAGTIAINVRRRDQTPTAFPKFSKRANGKVWNQALKEVGFDYGQTFQDMDDIRTDGKTYAATSKTMIKVTSGIMEGESRYVLHPSTIDSCLQLIIVSIYAGRLNDVTCGAVPIQVDEIAIWIPTVVQLENDSADVFSWTDERGIRSFVTGSRLVASNGELLVDISNMRCTAYEAAMPPSSSELISSQPYGEMVWVYDFDSLRPSSDLDEMDIIQLVELAIYKNPNLKVIEIGSNHARAILSRWKLLNYTSTEISSEAADEVASTLQGWKNARTQRLDISSNIKDQAVAEGSFDLVIAPAGISTSGFEGIRYLLQPRGHAIIGAMKESSMDHFRNTVSSLGFHINHQGKNALILRSATEKYPAKPAKEVQPKVQLVYRKEPASIISEVKQTFESFGWQTIDTSLKDYQSKDGEHVILLADFEGPLLATLEEKELAIIQEITSNASTLLWISCGGLLMGKKPEYAMTVGLARSIASEQISLDLTVLDFDLDDTSHEDLLDITAMMAQQQIAKIEPRESEYYVSNGIVYISRLVSNGNINSLYAFDKGETNAASFDHIAPIIGKVQSGKVVFEADMIEKEDLKSDCVEIKVTVAGLNNEDSLVISGSDYPTTFSHEICGVIHRVGESVIGLEVGDTVFGFSLSRFATVQRTPAYMIQKVEDGEDPLELATLPMAYGTALYGLRDLARLKANEIVLILGGTGCPGLAAIKVAQFMNAVPYVEVSTEAEAAKIMAEFGMDKKNILIAPGLSVIAQLTASTAGHGPDVVFSSGSVNANVAREAWRHMKPFGRFVDSGRKNVLKRGALDTTPLNRGANYLSFDILDLYHYKPQVLGDILQLTARLYRQRLIKPLRPVTIKSLGEIDTAVAHFSNLFAAGKTLILYESSNIPLNIVKSRPSLNLRPDATYLLVGCLGGLGRSLVSWMIAKGARRFVFLSRSGADSKQASGLIRDIEATGALAQIIRGDTSIVADVERAVEVVSAEYPIRGVVQAAMVLKDGLFQSMPYDNWIASTGPKVQGTLNLHNALKDVPLDFFAMTSSVSGILGTPGQSNYAAANTFLDSLATHRVRNGQKASSLILSMVLDVGYIAEHAALEEGIRRKGIYGIDEEHLLASFDVSMATQRNKNPVDHIVLGLDPAKLQKSINHSSATDVFWKEQARFKAITHVIDSASSEAVGESGKSLLSSIKSAATPAEATIIVRDHTIKKLSQLLLVDSHEFDPDSKAIADYGLDSMIGTDLRNWIFREFGIDIPFQQLLDPSLTITNFATQVCANEHVTNDGQMR